MCYDILNTSSHVTLPRELVKYVPTDRLMEEDEWRGLGVQQSLGWYIFSMLHWGFAIYSDTNVFFLGYCCREHYLIHKPEPHVLLFRREKDYQIKYPNGKPKQDCATNVGGLVSGR
jgi:cyclin-dependent kinase regulatory subunit CKS1